MEFESNQTPDFHSSWQKPKIYMQHSVVSQKKSPLSINAIQDVAAGGQIHQV